MSPGGPSTLAALQEAGELETVDLALADLIRRRWDGDHPAVSLAVALSSRASREGHVCLDVRQIAGRRLGVDSAGFALVAPDAAEWERRLRACAAVGQPGESCPLILDPAGRLYLARHWHDEQRLADRLRERACSTPLALSMATLEGHLNALFPRVAGETDWQRVAAAVAALRQLCVVSGGPGTGKTSTVAGILALLLRLDPGAPPRIALAAPTGKAASRLEQAVAASLEGMLTEPAQRAARPTRAHTIHRLLGSRSAASGFRHHAGNPLAVDVLVVDEASMVDLALMTRLLDALPRHARLILLGDRDQLASVQAGAVLGDICAGARGFSASFASQLEALAGPLEHADIGPASMLSDCVVLLRRSYRFAAAGGLGTLAAAVRDGQAKTALAALDAGGEVGWGRGGVMELAAGFHHFRDAVWARMPTNEVLQRFDRYRVLAALRGGPRGVVALNRGIERALGLARDRPPGSDWYRGRPIMIRRNDYALGLYNGDVGVALPDADGGGELRVYFVQPGGSLRSLSPLRLPEHETVYATTAHKSQGTEFESVAVVLPEQFGAALTRELLYTAVTRARTRVGVWASRSVLAATIAQPTRRNSGLRDALWGS
jgi:exodeoxyribonuclease V alpha subunit